MKFKIVISFCLIYFLLFNQVVAGVLFSEILPNTEDDINLEYIELYNSGSFEQSLSGFILKDKSEKEFIFGSGEILGSGQTKKYFRSETKILLNNSNEELSLYDHLGNLVDFTSYTGTIKGAILKILNFGILETNTGSGIINNTGSGIINNTGSGIINNTGNIDDIGIIKTNTGDLSNTGILIINTGSINILSGSFIDNNTGTVESFNLIFSFQNPSYVLEKDKILDSYICDNLKDECKINLDLRKSFTGVFNESDYECDIDFGFKGWLNGEENKCNPTTVLFPKGEYDLKFKITEKSNSGNVFTGGFLLKNEVKEKLVEVEKIITKTEIKTVYVDKIIYRNNYENKKNETNNDKIINNNEINKKTKTENNGNEKYEIKKNIELIIEKPEIIIQSGLDENKKCKKELCSLNLKYEEKQKGEKCLWDFDGGKYSIGTDKKCNPGYVKYGLGNYEVKLKVFQNGNEKNFKETVLIFQNEKIIKKENIFSSIISKFKNDNEELKIKNKIYNGDKNKGVQIYKIMPNPKGSDALEYVEIINNSNKKINLKGCYLDDKSDGGSNKYLFKNDEYIKIGKTKKYYKELTKINFNNDTDEVNLICNGILIDSLKWNFGIKEGYYLNHEKLEIKTGKAKVLKVIDGDTIEIQFLDSLRKERLRFIGVNTPETKHPDKSIEKFGIEAFNFTKSQLLGKKVLIEIDKNNFRDKYSRLLGYVILNGENFNEKLIKKGYGKAYLNYSFKYELNFKKSERKARKEEVGMWQKETNTTILNSFPSQEKEATDIKVDEEIIGDNIISGGKIDSGYINNENQISNTQKYNIISNEVKIKNIISSEVQIKEKIKPIISLQGKIGKNKIVKGNTITCIDKCSINFDGGNSIGGNIKKYIWDFGNGKTFEGKNPGYIKYEYYGNYKVNLKILSSKGVEETTSFYVKYITAPKKEKTKKNLNKTLSSKKEIKDVKMISGSKIGIKKDNSLLKENILDKKGMTKIEILLYILIFVFSLNLLAIILKREKLL